MALDATGFHGPVVEARRATLDIAIILDPTLPVARSTREILVRLGAKPYLERLDSALSESGQKPPPEPTTARVKAG